MTRPCFQALQSSWITGLFPYLTAYPALTALMGTSLPNYQGMFLRGYGSRTHYQQNGTENGYSTTTHSSGSLGAVQGDAIREISGYVNGVGANATAAISGAFYWEGTNKLGSDDLDYNNGYMCFSAARVVPTATEIRPANVAVNYLIKAY